jgi:hypothetical protein
MKKVTVVTLKKKYKDGSMLVCACCHSEYSSNPSDYFWKNSKEAFTCAGPECDDEPLQLVVKKTSYKLI